MNKCFLGALAALGIVIVGGALWTNLKDARGPVILNFEECVAAGNPVLESYPRQCRTPEGGYFTEVLDEDPAKGELIRVEAPAPNAFVESPLLISGEARGPWFFEASFTARLYTLDGESGEELGVGIMTAESDWMTEELVPFSGTLVFEAPDVSFGMLIFEKANPSGLPEHDDLYAIPVRFGEQ